MTDKETKEASEKIEAYLTSTLGKKLPKNFWINLPKDSAFRHF